MPVAIELGVALGLVLALVVCMGFLGLYRATLKPILLTFAAALDLGLHIPFAGTVHLLRPVARLVESLAAEIDYGISQAVLACEGGVVALWHGMAKQAEWLGGLLGDLAETIEGKFRWLLLAFPPALALWSAVHAVRALAHPFQVLQNAARAAEADIIRLGNGIDRLRRAIEAEITRDIARVRSAAGALGREQREAFARLRRAEKHLTVGGAAALVGVALSTLGLGWVRKPCAKNVANKFCNVHPDILEGLFAGLLALFATFSLAEFAKFLQPVVGEIGGEVTHFWRAEIAGQTADRAIGSVALTSK